MDEEVLDELESILISSDVGIDTTVKIINRFRERVRDKYLNSNELEEILRQEIMQLLTDNNTVELDDFELPSVRPYVIFNVGSMGVGKTATIGKLAYQFKTRVIKWCLGQATHSRAAAVDH